MIEESASDLIDSFAQALRIELSQKRNSNITLQLLRRTSLTPDCNLVFLVNDGTEKLVAYVSAPGYPTKVQNDQRLAQSFRSALSSPAVASVVPEPLEQGSVLGATYAVVPFYRPIATRRGLGRFECWRLAPHVLRWLEELVTSSNRRTTIDGKTRYEECLLALLQDVRVQSDIRGRARIAIEEVQHSHALPLVPMHGDMWKGNVLWARQTEAFPFVMIDWGSSSVDGFPFFDLVRLADSFSISSRQFSSAIKSQCAALSLRPEQTFTCILAALGEIWINRNEFPIDRFNAMGSRCLALWQRGLASL